MSEPTLAASTVSTSTSSKSTPLAWLIDDDTQTVQDIIHYWQSLERSPLRFRHFSTATEAWELLVAGEEKPSAIVIDGHLANDEGELASGVNFVRRVRSHTDMSEILIVAFSGDEYAVEDMESAGANAGFDKSKVRPVFDYLAIHCEA